MGALTLKPGQQRRLAAQVGLVAHALESERRMYDSSAAHAFDLRHQSLADVFAVDLLQGCAGQAGPTRLAARYGLRAADPADLLYGWDLRSRRTPTVAACGPAWPPLSGGFLAAVHALDLLQHPHQLQAPAGGVGGLPPW